MKSHFTISSVSVPGLSHSANEDSYYVGDNFVIIADGMGGEQAGDVASRIAIESVSAMLNDNACNALSSAQLHDVLKTAINKADENISAYIDLHPDCYGMGSTVIIIAFCGSEMIVAWCGDSHCYVLNGGHIKSLTRDHSYVRDLVDAGEITPEEAFKHPDNNLITRFVGGGSEYCIPEFSVHPLDEADSIILCSDGLSGYCKENDIEAVLASSTDRFSVANQLKELAMDSGSDDDITIVSLMAADSEECHASFLSRFKSLFATSR